MDSAPWRIPLTYAPRPPWWNRRRKMLRLVGMAMAMIVGMGLCRWGPGVVHQGQLLYWQQECKTFAPPQDQISYEQDGSGRSASYVPESLTRFLASNPETRTLAERTDGVLFMHVMSSPSGEQYLVVVGGSFVGANFNLQPLVFQLADWNSTSELKPASSWTDELNSSPREIPRLRFFAGQVDPNDPTHFTIPYEVDGRKDTIDGRLVDAKPTAPQLKMTSRRHPMLPFGI